MSLYDELGGFDTLLLVARRWRELCDADPVAGHPFQHVLHPQHDERFAAYLAEASGGPALYTGGYGGESSMQRLHAGAGAGAGAGPELHPMDEACLRLFDQALSECGVPADAAARLSAQFWQATRDMGRYWAGPGMVPQGLPMPRWV